MRKNVFMEDKMKKTGFLTLPAVTLIFLFAACNDYPSSIEVIYPRAPDPVSVEVDYLPGSNELFAKVEWTAGSNTSFFEIVRTQWGKNYPSLVVSQIDPSANAGTNFNPGSTTPGGGSGAGAPTWYDDPLLGPWGGISNSHEPEPVLDPLTQTMQIRWTKRQDVETEKFVAVISLRDPNYGKPDGEPFDIGVRAFSQFDNRWTTYSNIKWGGKQIAYKSPPIATRITIASNPTSDLTITDGRATMGRYTNRQFIADVNIVGDIKTDRNQAVLWESNTPSTEDNRPVFITSTGAIDTTKGDSGYVSSTATPGTTYYVIERVTVGTLTLDAIRLYISPTEDPGTQIRIRATYDTIRSDVDQSPVAPPTLSGQLIVTVGTNPPGEELDNNFYGRGSFTAATTPANASRFFWFERLSAAIANSDVYLVKFFGENNPVIPGWDTSGINSANLTMTLRFFDADGKVVGTPINADSAFSGPDYYYVVETRDFDRFGAKYLGIEVTNTAPGTNVGNFAVSWNSELPQL